MYLLKNFITIEDLEIRWRCDKELIESFTYENADEPHMIKYVSTEIRTRPDGGKTAIAKIARYLNGCIFDMADILAIEKNHPELIQMALDENRSGPKMIDGKFVFSEHQLIGKDYLYKRWIGATQEEITNLFNAGKLRAYEFYKGPINGVLWCKLGHIYYQSRNDYTSPSLYEYDDNCCDYFLLEDVVQCEAAHPEYVGNVTPQSLGLEQSNPPHEEKESPLHAGLTIITADEVIRRLKITPIELVDMLNGDQVLDDNGNRIGYARLRTIEEDKFRDYVNSGSNEALFNVQSLNSVKIYKIDFDRYCEKWGIQNQAKPETVDTLGLESQLAEAQKQVENLRQWNKDLNEKNQELQSELVRKDTRIVELEKALVAAKAEPTTTVNATKWESSVTAVFALWAEIVQGDKTNWKVGEFGTALAARYREYHTTVRDIAWRALPDNFKNGTGRPQKNLQKPQHSDNY